MSLTREAKEEARCALDEIRAGGLVLCGSRVGYALLGRSEASIRRLYQLKGRPVEKRCVVLATPETLPELATCKAGTESRIVDLARKTPVAVILPAKATSRLFRSLPPEVLPYCLSDGTVALYLGTGGFSEALAEMAAAVGIVLVGSSANLSRAGNNYSFDEVPTTIRQGVDLAFDHGVADLHHPDRLGGTMVNLATGNVHRMGINADLIRAELSDLLSGAAAQRAS